MNSKQRRKIKRDIKINYQHSVQLVRPRTMDWGDWGFHVGQITNWCKTQVNRECWMQDHKWIGTTFYFADASDAAFFTLKWL